MRSLAVGDVLAGKYEIVGLLGEGGMGAVWRAHSQVLDVDVAIKVLRGTQTDTLAGERLLREAQATAAFGHPAVVRAFDFGKTQADEPFFVMELLEGTSLGAWISEHGRMPATQAVQILLPIADGLAAAHARGIVHRDIKPGNILLVQEGEGGTCQPKIVDFGIAKLQKRSSQCLTEAGTVLGSLEYMSPEQADGKDVGEQADVWALCVVLYELITGRRPFHAESLAKMIVALYTTTPTATTKLAAGDDELWEIILRGLQKAPCDRWPSMRALGRALATWARARGVTTDSTGMSLDHVWLGRSSDALGLARSSRPDLAPVSSLAMSLELVGERTIAPVVASRDEPATPLCTNDTLVAPMPPPAARARGSRVAHVLGVLVVAPLLTVAGLHAQGARTTAAASGPAVGVSVAAQVPPAPTVAPTPAVPTAAPEAAPSAAPTVSPVVAPGKVPLSKPGYVAPRPRRTASSMPLPSSPGF